MGLNFVPRKGTKDLLCHQCFRDKKIRDRSGVEGVEARYSRFKGWRPEWNRYKRGDKDVQNRE